MSSEASICPHCQAEIPKSATPLDDCPACHRPLDAGTPSQPKTSRSRKRIWGAVAALALTVIMFEVWLTQGDHASTLIDAMPKDVQARIAQNPPSADPAPKAPAPRRRAADPRALKSSITISNGKGADKDGPPRPLFALGRLTFPEPGESDLGILLHEIFRQSVLMTAREDLGAMTRDESLGEATPADTPAATFELHSIRRIGQPLIVSIRRTNDTEGDPLWSAEIPLKDPNEAELFPVVEGAGALAREQLPEALKALGLVSRAAPAADPKGALSEDVERRLNQLTFTEQFAAVRATHEEIRRRGESPSRIGGLVRGYANLGILTEFHWNASNRAFKARALVEAQRWVAREPDSPDALEHRAYALALAGLHKNALDDLEQAKSKRAGKPGPDWSGWIGKYCRFETTSLASDGNSPHGQLAMLLAFLTVETTSGVARSIELAQRLLKQNPECYRVHDALCQLGGVSTLHIATLLGMQVLSKELPKRLKAQAGLPGRAEALVNEDAHEAKIAAALIDEGRDDRGELSWSVLGRMMREVRFAQVWRRLSFMRDKWSVPVADFFDEARPLIADHPYRPFLQSFVVDATHDQPLMRELLLSITIPDLEPTEFPYAWACAGAGVDNVRVEQIKAQIWLHTDTVYRDVLRYQGNGQSPLSPDPARRLERVSPHSPWVRTGLIRTDWAHVEAHAKEWEAASGDHPEVLIALGYKYIDAKKWDDARRCLTRSLELSPDKTPYELLARSYKEQGDLAKWQETLEQFLEREEDPGLDHARVQVDLANHFMEQGQWEKAEPFADAAAQTWASWAMECASRCHEGLKEYDEAGLWASRVSQRYPEQSWAFWVGFCKRTGHGDYEAARDLAYRQVEAIADRAGPQERMNIGFLYLLCGDREKALYIFRSVVDDQNAAPALLATAFTADALGGSKLRDESFENFVNGPKTKQLGTARLCVYFIDLLKKGNSGQIDLKVIDEILGKIVKESQANATFVAGWFLLLQDSPEHAKVYLQRAIDARETYDWFRALAQDALRSPPGGMGRPTAEPDAKPKS